MAKQESNDDLVASVRNLLAQETARETSANPVRQGDGPTLLLAAEQRVRNEDESVEASGGWARAELPEDYAEDADFEDDGPLPAAPATSTSLADLSEEPTEDPDLRNLVTEIVRQELAGELGERITRNVRKLVRREIARAMTGADADEPRSGNEKPRR